MHILSLICSLIVQVGKFQSVILRKFRPVLTLDQLDQLAPGETGHIQDLRGAGPDIGTSSRSHGSGLLSLEGQDSINRD